MSFFEIDDEAINTVGITASPRARKSFLESLPSDFSEKEKELLFDQVFAAANIAISEGLRAMKPLKDKIKSDRAHLAAMDLFAKVLKQWSTNADDRMRQLITGDYRINSGGCGDPSCPACSDKDFDTATALRELINKIKRSGPGKPQEMDLVIKDDTPPDEARAKAEELRRIIRATAEERRQGRGAMMIGHVDERTGKHSVFQLDNADIAELDDILSKPTGFKEIDEFFERVRARQEAQDVTFN